MVSVTLEIVESVSVWNWVSYGLDRISTFWSKDGASDWYEVDQSKSIELGRNILQQS